MPDLDPFQELVQRSIADQEKVEGARITQREAADRCGIPLTTFHYHVFKVLPGRRSHKVPEHIQLAVHEGLGIPLDEVQRAALAASKGHNVDVASYDLAELIAFWDPPGLSPAEKDRKMRQALQEHLDELDRRAKRRR